MNVYWNPKRAMILHTKEEEIYNVIEQSSQVAYEQMEGEVSDEERGE